MPWERPKPRTYEYNYKIQNSYYKPVLTDLDKGKKELKAHTFAERLKTYPLHGGEYPEYPEEVHPTVRRGSLSAGEFSGPREFYLPRSTRGIRESSEPSTSHRTRRIYERDTEGELRDSILKLQRLEERQFPARSPIWQKHPYYMADEAISVPPSEDSVWPEFRPHFHLVSSYDCMVGYLGLRGMAERDAERMRRTH